MKTAYIKNVLALLLFGSNGIVASYILMNSYEIVFWRGLIGSLFLIFVFVIVGGKFHAWKNKRHFVYVIISGVAMGASWMFLYEAYAQIGVSISTLAYYCGPVIVMGVSPFIFRERLTAAKTLGLASVLLGMFFVNGRGLLQSGISWGLLCGISSAIMYAVMVIFNKKAASITGLENSMNQLSVGFITVAIFTFIKQGAVITVEPGSLFPILVLGLVNTGIGCYLYFSSIDRLSAASVSIIGYLEPLSALIFSALFLHERLSYLQIIGAVLILSGAAFGELFRNKAQNETNAVFRSS